MNKIKAAFFDIDGTLLSFATRRVPASAVRALEGMRAAGIRLFIASGRPPMYLGPLRAELDFRFDGYVLTNGQCCTDAEGVPFYNRALPAGSVPALLRWLEEHPDVVCTFCEEDYVYDNRHSEAVDARCRASGMGLPHHPIEDPARALTHVTYQLNAYMPPALDAPFAAAVPGFRAVRWNEVFADVIPADGGKTEGMARMLARFGLTPAESIAFGDGGNDIEMLCAAGIGVAMGNAAPAVQAAADYVTASVDEDGIWKAVQHFRLLEHRGSLRSAPG